MANSIKFLYIDPIKQGLKHKTSKQTNITPSMFLYIDPIKQGLKQNSIANNYHLSVGFYT